MAAREKHGIGNHQEIARAAAAASGRPPSTSEDRKGDMVGSSKANTVLTTGGRARARRGKFDAVNVLPRAIRADRRTRAAPSLSGRARLLADRTARILFAPPSKGHGARRIPAAKGPTA